MCSLGSKPNTGTRRTLSGNGRGDLGVLTCRSATLMATMIMTAVPSISIDRFVWMYLLDNRCTMQNMSSLNAKTLGMQVVADTVNPMDFKKDQIMIGTCPWIACRQKGQLNCGLLSQRSCIFFAKLYIFGKNRSVLRCTHVPEIITVLLDFRTKEFTKFSRVGS